MRKDRLAEAFASIEAYARSSLESQGTPSVSLAVTGRRSTLGVITLGYSDVFAKTPAEPDHLYQIGSISKAFTSIALLKLREAGRVDLHRPVTEYLPWFKLKKDRGPITLHHLMSHTGGIVMGSDATSAGLSEVWALRETEASTPPGSYFHYSNSGYKVLGLVLEEMFKKPQGDVIRDEVLLPLGMRSSSSVISNEIRPLCAVGHVPLMDDRPWVGGMPLSHATWFESDTADGSICSTPDDMCKYLRMLLNRGRTQDDSLISEESFGLLAQRVVQPEDAVHGEYYGYGLNIDVIDGHECLAHSGGMVGYHSDMVVDTDAGLGVIVLVNGPGAPHEISRFALRAARAALEELEFPSLPGPSDSSRADNASDYAGTYGTGPDAVEVVVKDGGLLLVKDGRTARLLRYALDREKDVFIIGEDDPGLFPLRFWRRDGLVTELTRGPDWYPGAGYDGPTAFEHPTDWEAYIGHYRSHNPWLTNFRVVSRKGRLLLIMPSGAEEPMEPLLDGSFRVGSDARSPERLRFGTIVRGRAAMASLSGGRYYRTFTP